jgi:hypothetical protein
MGGSGPPVRRSAPTANFPSLLARAPEQFCQVSPVSRRTQLGARQAADSSGQGCLSLKARPTFVKETADGESRSRAPSAAHSTVSTA